MVMKRPEERQTRAVNLRIREDICRLIDQAARAQGKTRSDFMIDAARKAAEEAILDQTLVRIDSESQRDFLAMLDTPPGGLGFERLMSVSKTWKS